MAVFPWGRERATARLAADPARLQLLPVETLRAEAASAGLAAAGASASERAGLKREHALILLHLAARTGETDLLDRAARLLRALPAGPEAVEVALLAAELAGDGALLDNAAARLADLPATADPLAVARRLALEAALAARRTLDGGDRDGALRAAAVLDEAAEALARRHGRGCDLTLDLARLRSRRAELLTAWALRLRDPAPAARAAADMADLAASLDPDRLPLTHGLAQRLRAEALLAEGDLSGDARGPCEAARLLSDLLGEMPAGHAPLERARASRALAHAARLLAEHTQDEAEAEALSDAALSAFACAQAELGPIAAPPLRAAIAFERALHLARRAERRAAGPDGPWALARAESALKAELAARDAVGDPAAWAAVQVALARLYMSAGGRRAEAALALETALEVFAEQGLKALADTALDALDLLRAG